jgi:hypothetical protein
MDGLGWAAPRAVLTRETRRALGPGGDGSLPGDGMAPWLM